MPKQQQSLKIGVWSLLHSHNQFYQTYDFREVIGNVELIVYMKFHIKISGSGSRSQAQDLIVGGSNSLI